MELANSIVTLQPGMYILRHPKTGLPPISISRAAGKVEHNGSVQALYTPGTDGSVLRDGRDCIIMQVLNAAVDLLVTAYLEKAGATVPALKIEKIKLDEGINPATPIHVPEKGISLIGHIERIGDLVAEEGEVLTGSEGDLRLEGFQVMWPDKPEGLEIRYTARIEGVGEMPVVSTGKFCGTRNAARRITGVRFELAGPQANQFAIVGQASFSGGFSADLSSGLFASGPTGMEHLTALGLAVEKLSAPRTGWEPSSRTKVFKAAKDAATKRSRA